MTAKLTRQDFDSDLLIAEQQAYGQGQIDAQQGNASTPDDYPDELSAAYRAGFDDECENL